LDEWIELIFGFHELPIHMNHSDFFRSNGSRVQAPPLQIGNLDRNGFWIAGTKWLNVFG
jgi:hypothetical protein